MFLCRLTGWCFLLTALLAASAEAVVALGTVDHVGIATSDIFTIITGSTPSAPDTFAGKIMLWPAWSLIGALGLFLVFVSRNKRNRSSFSD